MLHCATEFRLQAEGDEGRGRAGREGGRVGEDEDSAQRGVCMLVSLREILASKAKAEEEQVVKQQYNSAQARVLHPSNI